MAALSTETKTPVVAPPVAAPAAGIAGATKAEAASAFKRTTTVWRNFFTLVNIEAEKEGLNYIRELMKKSGKLIEGLLEEYHLPMFQLAYKCKYADLVVDVRVGFHVEDGENARVKIAAKKYAVDCATALFLIHPRIAEPFTYLVGEALQLQLTFDMIFRILIRQVGHPLRVIDVSSIAHVERTIASCIRYIDSLKASLRESMRYDRDKAYHDAVKSGHNFSLFSSFCRHPDDKDLDTLMDETLEVYSKLMAEGRWNERDW